jgi:hypothetical protein
MGSFEKYCARSFFFWMSRFLRRQYEKVDIVFIAHHTEAKEVTEEEFFTRGESEPVQSEQHADVSLQTSGASAVLILCDQGKGRDI